MESDERKETAMAATPVLQPNFHSSSVTQDELDKFKELRRRRLQIKSRSKIHKHSKGNVIRAANPHGKEHGTKGTEDNSSNIISHDLSSSTAKGNTCVTDLDDKLAPPSALKKRQKLHWGLDTRERWERKANM